MSLIVVGTNHKISPLAIREKLSFSKKEIPGALVNLLNHKRAKAGVILSTCNRVELYAETADTEYLKEFLADYHCRDLKAIEPYLYTYIGKNAAEHLFQVTCGLDSQIIGEIQILEQVRAAFQQARQVEATDRILDTVFTRAIELSLKVRQETGICQGKVSIASIIMDLLKTRYSFLKDKKVLLIGTGKIGELVVKYLKKEGLKTVFIANRSYERAKPWADYINGQIVGFDRLKEKLKEADIVISATSSPHLILRKDDFSDLNKPLLIIDLAVPRDVDPQVKSIEGVSLLDLDALDFIITKNLSLRRQSIQATLSIIKKEADNLCLTEYLELEPAGAPLL